MLYYKCVRLHLKLMCHLLRLTAKIYLNYDTKTQNDFSAYRLTYFSVYINYIYFNSLLPSFYMKFKTLYQIKHITVI